MRFSEWIYERSDYLQVKNNLDEYDIAQISTYEFYNKMKQNQRQT